MNLLGLNLPQDKLPETREPGDFRSSMHWRVLRVIAEFVDGWQFLGDLKKNATIFGSARFKEGEKWYEEARTLGKLLAQADFNVITGGGPGIMEGGNRGAAEARETYQKGDSVGLNIQLPYEQRVNPYVRKGMGFHYFFTRKVMLAYSSQVYIYFPGGYGTLDEFFEIINLIQNKRIDPDVIVILVGKDYWNDLLVWLRQYIYEVHGFVKEKDLYSYTLVDTAEEAFKIVSEKAKDAHQDYTL
jgi:uncharacterized protein (TIGR00730 family)